MLSRYTNFIIQYHKWIILFSIALIVCLGAGAKNLKTTSDFRIYFSEDNPQLIAFEALEKTYGKQDSLLFFLQPKNKNIFTKENLSLILELTDKAWNLPYANRVNSLTNYQHTEVNGDDLNTEYLVEEILALTPNYINKVKNIVLNEPSLVNLLTDTKGQVTGIQVRLNLPNEKNAANTETVLAARKLRQEFEQRYPNVKINIGGSSAAGVTLGEAVALDISTLVLWSYLIIIALLVILLRSLRGMLVTVLLVSFSIIVTMGIYGWFNYTMAPVAGWVPSIIMTIAVADSVHILISYFHSLRYGLERHDALRESLRINLNPVFITSITTIIGVLCLNFSDSPPYRDLGNMVALGVLIAFILSVTFLPAVLAWFSIGNSHVKRGQNVWMDNFANAVILYRKKFSLLCLFLFSRLLALYQIMSSLNAGIIISMTPLKFVRPLMV